MEPYKLGEMEQKFADLIWKHAPITTGELVKLCEQTFEWKRTTTYTMLKKCVEKGLVERTEPGFLCRALPTRAEVRRRETRDLIDRMYGGSPDLLVASLLDGKTLSGEEIARLRRTVEELK